jgi:hypothetical protein
MTVVKVTSSPLVRRLNMGPVEAVRLKFQSGVRGAQGPIDPTLSAGLAAEITARTAADALRVLKSGDTMTGNLWIEKVDPGLFFHNTGGTTNKRKILLIPQTDEFAWGAYNDATVYQRTLLTLKHDGGVIPTHWTTAQRPASTVAGTIGYNTDTSKLEIYTTAWYDAGPNVVVDRAYTEYTANAALTALIPVDDTIPTISEGTQILSVSLTPKNATNRVRLSFAGNVAADAAGRSFAITLYAGSTGLRTIYGTAPAADYGVPVAGIVEHVPGVTTAVTYTVRAGPAAGAGSIRFNGTSSARLFGGACAAVLVLEEIKG